MSKNVPNFFHVITAIVCENRLLVPNGSTECSDGTALGSVCIVTCNRRYELEGAEQATCIDDDADPLGVWTAPVPSCNSMLVIADGNQK